MSLLPSTRRNFRLVLGASVASSLGDNLHNLALPLLVLTVTGSSSQAGLVLALGSIAHLVGGPVAGAVVDRLERRSVMIWCDAGRAILVASLPVCLAIGEFHMAQVYVVTVLLGALTTLFQAASNALLPRIVEPAALPTAVSTLQASGSVMGILGTPLAGIVYGLGRTVPFVFNALSFACSAVAVRFVQADTRPLHRGSKTKLRADVREGLQWLAHQPTARRLTVIQAADNLRYGAGYLLIILLARRAGAGPTEVGLVFSGAAAGAALGAAAGGRIVSKYPPGRILTPMLCVEAAVFPVYALVPTWPWLVLIAFVESVVLLIYVIALTELPVGRDAGSPAGPNVRNGHHAHHRGILAGRASRRPADTRDQPARLHLRLRRMACGHRLDRRDQLPGRINPSKSAEPALIRPRSVASMPAVAVRVGDGAGDIRGRGHGWPARTDPPRG